MGDRVWRAESSEHAGTGAAHRRGGYSLPSLTQDMSSEYLPCESRAIDNLFLAYKSYKTIFFVSGALFCRVCFEQSAALVIVSYALLNFDSCGPTPRSDPAGDFSLAVVGTIYAWACIFRVPCFDRSDGYVPTSDTRAGWDREIRGLPPRVSWCNRLL